MAIQNAKQDDEVLAEIAEQELRPLMDNMISPFSYYRMRYDAEGQPLDLVFLAVNKAFELETGLKREDVIGKNVLCVFQDKDAHWVECFERVAKTGVAECLCQYSFLLNKWFNAVIYSPKPGYAAITASDISPYIAEREELEKTTRALKLQMEENERLARIEPISGLPNRKCLYEAFAARRLGNEAKQFSLAIFGPDNLAEILASYGSTISDRVMFDLTQRLNALCGAGDALFSMTGTDLVLLIEDSDDLQPKLEKLTKFLDSIREPVEYEGIQFYVSAKCGVANVPLDGTECSDAIMKANLALYEAKKRGEPFVFYNEQFGRVILRRLQIQNLMPKAMLNHEFELYYQPQFEISTGKIIGVEALLRWHSPELGEVSPLEFIPIAEKSRLIQPLGMWVLETACEALQRIERERHFPLRMAVNVSGVQLAQDGFCDLVTDRLRSMGIAPARLELEITESVVLFNENKALEQLERLSVLGIRIALDDFGTGYSTMSLLKDLHVSTIKIDRTFIQDEKAQVMNRVMVRLGHILDAKVVAEGVETPEHMNLVRRYGYDAVQGFLFSLPLPLDALLQLIETLQNDAILL